MKGLCFLFTVLATCYGQDSSTSAPSRNASSEAMLSKIQLRNEPSDAKLLPYHEYYSEESLPESQSMEPRSGSPPNPRSNLRSTESIQRNPSVRYSYDGSQTMPAGEQPARGARSQGANRARERYDDQGSALARPMDPKLRSDNQAFGYRFQGNEDSGPEGDIPNTRNTEEENGYENPNPENPGPLYLGRGDPNQFNTEERMPNRNVEGTVTTSQDAQINPQDQGVPYIAPEFNIPGARDSRNRYGDDYFRDQQRGYRNERPRYQVVGENPQTPSYRGYDAPNVYQSQNRGNQLPTRTYYQNPSYRSQNPSTVYPDTDYSRNPRVSYQNPSYGPNLRVPYQDPNYDLNTRVSYQDPSYDVNPRVSYQNPAYRNLYPSRSYEGRRNLTPISGTRGQELPSIHRTPEERTVYSPVYGYGGRGMRSGDEASDSPSARDRGTTFATRPYSPRVSQEDRTRDVSYRRPEIAFRTTGIDTNRRGSSYYPAAGNENPTPEFNYRFSRAGSQGATASQPENTQSGQAQGSEPVTGRSGSATSRQGRQRQLGRDQGTAFQRQPPQVPDNYDYRPFSFNYVSEAEDGMYTHQQSSDNSGRVVGSYAMTLEDGRRRIVEYIADENGFRASIDTNEPGTSFQDNPADVVFYGGGPTVNRPGTQALRSHGTSPETSEFSTQRTSADTRNIASQNNRYAYNDYRYHHTPHSFEDHRVEAHSPRGPLTNTARESRSNPQMPETRESAGESRNPGRAPQTVSGSQGMRMQNLVNPTSAPQVIKVGAGNQTESQSSQLSSAAQQSESNQEHKNPNNRTRPPYPRGNVAATEYGSTASPNSVPSYYYYNDGNSWYSTY